MAHQPAVPHHSQGQAAALSKQQCLSITSKCGWVVSTAQTEPCFWSHRRADLPAVSVLLWDIQF